MAIVQISKIQQRSGNLVDLPQLDEAEFGWATDAKRLFIGKTVPNENIEVLTSYSNISFSQLNGAVGNLNITAVTAEAGQVLTYDGTNWVNRGGTSGGTIKLGDASNVKINGGAIGYVLETDGTGNLSWTPKSAVVFYIDDVSQANPGVVTTTTDNYLVSGAEVSITEVVGMTQLNGNSYYVNSLTANTFSLYSDSGLTTPVDTTLFTAYVSGGRIVSAIGSGGTTAAGGSNTAVQFNNNNLLNGSADFTWNFATNLLTINGNANISNVNVANLVSASRFTSNVATGTAPITVTSTTRVANLNVSYANVSDFNVVTAQTTGTYYPVFVSGSSTANYALAANSSISANIANSSITATTFVGSLSGAATTAGTVTTAAQPNITSVGTLSSLSVTGNITGGNLLGALANGTSNVNIPASNGNVNISVGGNANVLVVSSTGANVTGNLGVSANVVPLGIKTDNYYYANGAAISFAGSYSNSNVASYLPTYTGQVGTGVATFYGTTLTTGANTTAGTITGDWTLTTGSKLQATYADLAEYYTSDLEYPPGTVVEFGGDAEVTLASDGSARVAGVVSTNPAYAMNAKCEGDYVVALALQGRVPCKVRGTIQKGDMMISAGGGYARPAINPSVGTVIGKALENFSGNEGIIEVAVGRL